MPLTPSDPSAARPLRVLRITTTLEPEIGGPANSAVHAAVAEQANAINTTLVSTCAAGAPQDPHPHLVAAGVEHRVFRRAKYKPGLGQRWAISPQFLWWIVRNLRRYDIVHVHYVWPLGALLGVFGGRLTGRPVVMTPHESMTDFGIEKSRSAFRTRQKRIVRRLLLSCVDRVVTASELELRDSGLAAPQGVVIPHPVPPGAPRHRVGDSEQFVVGYLGRLHPKKRVEIVLRAVARCEPAVELVVGGGQPVSELERLVDLAGDLEIVDQTTFLGFVSPGDRDAFFNRIDVLVMPSSYECFGMSAAEALAAGVPAIVTDQTGISEVIAKHGGGQIVPTEDVDAVVAAITKMAKAPESAELQAEHARTAASEAYSFGQYGARIRDVYDSILK